MTSLDPKRPLRDVTPEERARAARMVWLIVLGLPTIVGVMVAYLTFNGRRVRDYGKAVLQAVETSPSTVVGPAGLPCEDANRFRRPPEGVTNCRVVPSGDGLIVVLEVEGGRQYQVSNTGGKVTDKVNTAEAAARVYAAKVANDFPAFVKANNPPALEVQSVPCAKVLPEAAPAGVASCQVQSGPADGAQVAVQLTDGRTVTVDF